MCSFASLSLSPWNFGSWQPTLSAIGSCPCRWAWPRVVSRVETPEVISSIGNTWALWARAAFKSLSLSLARSLLPTYHTHFQLKLLMPMFILPKLNKIILLTTTCVYPPFVGMAVRPGSWQVQGPLTSWYWLKLLVPDGWTWLAIVHVVQDLANGRKKMWKIGIQIENVQSSKL